jgi:adenylate cyclase
MTAGDIKHRLAALLSADVVGYSRLMAEDEVATVRTLSAYRDKISTIVHDHEGRVVDFVGDNMLAEFHSVIEAVDCATNMQRTLALLNAKLDENRQMSFRIGINLGDILIDGDVIYGDGINVAARLERLAKPGGICITESVFSQVHNKLELGFADIGMKTLKNISDPVRVYRVVAQGAETPPPMDETAAQQETRLPLPAKPSDYFSDGLTMDIMTALVRIPGLFLISEISMFSFKSQAPTVGELRYQLGVSHVLDGGVRRAGDRVRITARLIETSSGRQVWAERYDKKIDDIFAVQDEITERIVEAMDIKLVTGEMAPTLRKVIRNADALESYYRGWEALFGSSKDDIIEAQQRFEDTMQLEPESCFGYAMAAWAHWWAVGQGFSEDTALSLQRAAELSRKAMDLEDFTGLPHLIMAQIHLFNREHDKALEAVEDAVLARPSCDLSFVTKANILTYLGRSSEAIELAKFAIRLSPVYPPFFQTILAAAYYGSGRYEEAIAAAEDTLKSDRENLDAFLILSGAIQPDFTLQKYAETQRYKDPQTLKQVVSMLQKAGLH